MKQFSIDIEVVESAMYASGIATVRAKANVSPMDGDNGYSELHMSETTMRLLHQALGKILTNVDTMGALSVTAFPSLSASGSTQP